MCSHFVLSRMFEWLIPPHTVTLWIWVFTLRELSWVICSTVTGSPSLYRPLWNIWVREDDRSTCGYWTGSLCNFSTESTFEIPPPPLCSIFPSLPLCVFLLLCGYVLHNLSLIVFHLLLHVPSLCFLFYFLVTISWKTEAVKQDPPPFVRLGCEISLHNVLQFLSNILLFLSNI